MRVDPHALLEEAIRNAQGQAKPAPPLQWLDMSNWDNEPVPERKWAIRDRVPLRQAGLFSGEGGTGKSILELTKNVAHVIGKDWLGSLPELGSTFYLSAEDDVDELHIRLAAIVEHYTTTFAEITDGGLYVLPLLGKAARDRRTPIQAKHFMSAMRGLLRWAFRAKLIKSDPTAGVTDLPLPRNDGHLPWSDDDVIAYEAHWPMGTRQRVWFDVLAYTGLRRGDAVRLGRQHVRNGVATIKTEKTGAVVTLPILATLARTLTAGPCGDLTFIAGKNGRPLTKESFGNPFRQACRDAGLMNRSAHGLRKAAATRAAEHGATEAELAAIFGWSGGRMASLTPALLIGSACRSGP